jgi:hypothetical protein
MQPGPAFATPSSAAVRRCDNPDGQGGIMAYRNECHFLKTVEDDGNPSTGPDIVEPENESQKTDSSASGFTGQSWMSEQRIPARDSTSNRGLPMQGLPVLPSVSGGSMGGFGQSDSATDNDMSLSPEAQSNRPTPNSSSASDHRPHTNGHQVSGSGPNSFEASPVSAHQPLTSPNAIDSTQQQQPPPPPPPQAYYGGHDAFGINNMNPNQRFPASTTGVPGVSAVAGVGGVAGFEVPSWQDMSSQPGMTPVAEGVLRSLMNMGPMDAMDLSSWDSGN